MTRLINFIRMAWLHKSISSAVWIDAYDNYKPKK